MSAAATASSFLDLATIRSARGDLYLPGSKSVSIRALLLAALADGETCLSGLLDSDDARVMREALKACGVPLQQHGDEWQVRGAARFPIREADIFVGNSGLSVRTLVAVLAFMEGRYRLSGVPRMHERPIGDLVDALRPLGAQITYSQQDGFPPLLIEPAQARSTQPVRVRGDASSQFLTGILQSAPLLAREHDLIVDVEGELISKPYIDLSIALMQRFGVTVERSQTESGTPRFTVAAGARYLAPGRFHVEGDASSASYFLALGALAGGPVRVHGMGSSCLQGDVRFIDVLSAMGADVTQGEDWTEVQSAGLAGGFRPAAFDTDFNHIPDAAMTAAVMALFADGPCVLKNIGSWRVKETDRIAAMATELAKLGAAVEAGPDFLRITPPAVLKTAAIDTYDDHRMAMSFSLAACGVPLRIHDPGCVAKTFPDYFLRLAALTSA
ncbi:3-phosphoshikimate 1-carboxyvinyltransferase [Hydrocarboniphaga daqingensis]|uniref:3-phosphoshikimate 1-carboxyvinyltransferase n=1 Tax=Hydrocarboniphaga daqingensis TaxID=490188 RepID=A0A1M5PUP9_9GAMM|nr:3-phosphoshikimate 1-carboxyvinyltransferase [Hydrocarboniphaga daqingensis]SHH05380.1 3-phosphoshikimate 1-carboxyvinyltransferase [Hydrocarboniphaga daqingensis]